MKPHVYISVLLLILLASCTNKENVNDNKTAIQEVENIEEPKQNNIDHLQDFARKVIDESDQKDLSIIVGHFLMPF